jgi:hypothetical protein
LVVVTRCAFLGVGLLAVVGGGQVWGMGLEGWCGGR